MPAVHSSCGTRVTGWQQHVPEGELGTCPAPLVVGSCAGASPMAVQHLERLTGLFPRHLHKTWVRNMVKKQSNIFQGLLHEQQRMLSPGITTVEFGSFSLAATSLGGELSYPAGITKNICWQESNTFIPPQQHKATLKMCAGP